MKFTKKRIENLSKFFFSLAQIVFGVIIIGKFITPEKVSFQNFVVGLLCFSLLAFFGYLIDRGGE